MAKKRTRPSSKRTPDPAQPDRRSRHALREVLNELIEHVRTVARAGPDRSNEDVEYAQQRLEWLADEIWRLTEEGDTES